MARKKSNGSRKQKLMRKVNNCRSFTNSEANAITTAIRNSKKLEFVKYK